MFSAFLLKTQNEQRQLYNIMFQKGWYKLEPAEATKTPTKIPTIPRLYQPISIWRTEPCNKSKKQYGSYNYKKATLSKNQSGLF